MDSERGQGRCDTNEITLVNLSIEGDQKAFRRLMELYRAKILSICLNLLRDKVDAEEAAQDSFVKIYLHLKDFDQTKNFGVWAASIAVNTCRDRLRRRVRAGRIFREITDADADRAHEPAEDVESKERLAAVERALEKLPSKLKEVIVLKAYGNYSYEDIAGILKVRAGTVMSRLFRARAKLTGLMGKERKLD